MEKIRRSFIVILFVVVTLGVTPSVGTAQEQPSDRDKRSSIHQVDGFAYLSEDKTLGQIRSEAFALAKRQALEAAQTYMQSKTKVEDGNLTYDLIWSQADGSVRILEQKDHGVEENSRYHVWIKAEVFYDIAPKKHPRADGGEPDPVKALLKDEAAPLTVKVWTDKKTYVNGEEVVIHLQGNRDFFGVVVDIMANGDIVQLLPNDHRSNNFFKAGIKYRIPDAQDQYSLAVSPPYGTDRIVVYASEEFMNRLPTQAIGGGLGVFLGTKTDLSQRARGINIQAKKASGPNQGAEFYEAQWSFSTVSP